MPQEVFERHAWAYDQWFVLHRTVYRAECERIRAVLPAPDARTVEVGVGSGRFAAPLGIPVGIEPSVALGQMARQRGIEVIRGVGEMLPLKDRSCSSVLMVTVICFFDDPARAIAEAYRVLVPGGVLVAGFLERGAPLIQAHLRGETGHRFLSQGRFFTSVEVQALLRDAGFSIRSAESEHDFCVIVAEKCQETERV
ncbi:class I SAM-dependent methyltransferase [Methanogenium organophilum]|uniref:Class I SAM-dependent methyltransferase n=1 Tax=Methanogenium organophilum TaxID=2199 RepID=A0A9X9S434_METOG|nr:class I SAM-dependent methyltransferase [Methanogenium organophilum]WAI00530.1 class I SAM-dependent methyltransferase [Methanogenium organophilum]